MEASLTCAVCLGLFKEPVTLPLCSHNFCRRCVQGCVPSPQGPLLQLCCPLCRKVSSMPGGATHLPVNTTLAEVVKLLRAAPVKDGGEEAASGCAEPCQQHPGRRLQLYCRVCHQEECGQCVSEEHQGSFHSINLMDITYQEEKLTFFSTLKKLREVGEKLAQEITDDPNVFEDILHNETEMIASKFDEITKILDLKKKQLLENISKQRSKRVKEHQLWKQMKDVDAKTVENFLDECDKIINECDPPSFLKVACDLNKRMNTKLDLLHVSSSFVSAPKFKPAQVDIKPMLDAISLMHITSEDNFKDPFAERKQDATRLFPFQTSKTCGIENSDISPDTFCELRLKNYDLIVNSKPENKDAASSLPEGKPLPITNNKYTVWKAKYSMKEKAKPIRKSYFDESRCPSFSIVPLYKPLTSPRVSAIQSINCERSQKVDGLSVPLQDNADLSQSACGTGIGEIQTKSVNTPAIQTSSKDSHPLRLFSNALLNSNQKVVPFSVGGDTLSSTKEMTRNALVLPNWDVEKCVTPDKSKLVEHWSYLYNISTSSSGTVSANLVPSAIEPTVGKPSASFQFGNVENIHSKSSSFKLVKPSPFSLTLPKSVKLTEESANVKIGTETKENMKSQDEKFSWLKLVAPDSKELNASASKSWTSSKSTAKKDAGFKKTPSIPSNNLLLFSSNSLSVKPPYASGFSFESTSTNTVLPLSSALMSFPKVSESNIRERGKEAANSSCLANSVREKSVPVETGSVAGLANHSLFTFPFNLSRKSPTPCISSENVSCTSNVLNAVQSNLFTREASSVPNHLATITVPQDKDNATTSENSKLGNVSEDSPGSKNTLDSVLHSQNGIPPTAEYNDAPSGICPNKEASGMLTVKEYSDVDDANKETSSSDGSSTSDEETMRKKGKKLALRANVTDNLSLTFPLEDHIEDMNSSLREEI